MNENVFYGRGVCWLGEHFSRFVKFFVFHSRYKNPSRKYSVRFFQKKYYFSRSFDFSPNEKGLSLVKNSPCYEKNHLRSCNIRLSLVRSAPTFRREKQDKPNFQADNVHLNARHTYLLEIIRIIGEAYLKSSRLFRLRWRILYFSKISSSSVENEMKIANRGLRVDVNLSRKLVLPWSRMEKGKERQRKQHLFFGADNVRWNIFLMFRSRRQHSCRIRYEVFQEKV